MTATPEYKHGLRPNLDYLARCGKLLLDTRDLANFLQVPMKTARTLSGSNRVPQPVNLGLGKCSRWNALELLDWVATGCPQRDDWVKLRGRRRWPTLWW
jgi:predicted DNA-binding transcriptional regulator AlpA